MVQEELIKQNKKRDITKAEKDVCGGGNASPQGAIYSCKTHLRQHRLPGMGRQDHGEHRHHHTIYTREGSPPM